jgi:23S rRNA pseudouridine1911/1915/1917 synthase
MAGLTTEVTLTVADDPPAGGSRLDAFVHAALPGLSRRLVQRLIAEGAVRLNGRPAPKGARLDPGDRVTLPALPASITPEPALSLAIAHEDDHLVAVEKPGGMRGHAVDPRERGTAAAFLVARYPEMAGVGDPLAPGLVHRLDTGTSGLLLAARTPPAHAAVRAALRARAVEKRYLAVVEGSAQDLDGRHVDLSLAHDPRDRRRMVPATGTTRAWPAETAVATLGVGGGRTLLEVTIRTGVTHQVRAHLAYLGHPVLGDVLYGGHPAGLPAGRHALHASRLQLRHPGDGHLLTLESPLPDDLGALM